ncbi:MAG TPA: sensor histidine kinase [Thermoanaerobaculia bacterium]|nr:sensor histidine kinase [Thermoanaerobaculia bacterium]
MAERKLVLVGYLTWIALAIPHGMIAVKLGAPWTWYAAFGGFLVAYAIATKDRCKTALQWWMIGAQAALALVSIALMPNGFLPVLLVIVAGELGHLRVLPAVAWITTQSVVMYLVTGTIDHHATMTVAYLTFQLFGFFTARIAVEEHEARQSLSEANAELRVTSGLLDLSSRTEERLRIARDLHDLLGHHLTALSLNLEVASHLTEGAAKVQVEKSKSITKLLLSDVRDVVSKLRDEEPLDLGAAIRSLRDVVPSPAIELDEENVAVSDPIVAQTALRAVQEIVTNAVRHSGARRLFLHVGRDNGTLAIDARDDGSGTDQVTFGNGLRGMRERVQQSGGTMEVSSMRGRGFEVHVRLPL